MCSCFDWRFNCKNCPNKCSADKHKIINYEYPDYNYDTIFNIIKKYDNNYENSMKFKSTLPYEYLLNKMQEKQNEIKNKLEMKLVKIKNINSICLIDNNNDDIEKLFEDKKNIYTELKKIDENKKILKEKINNLSNIDEFDDIKELKSNILQINKEIEKIDDDLLFITNEVDLEKNKNIMKDEINKTIINKLIEMKKENKEFELYDYLIFNLIKDWLFSFLDIKKSNYK